MTRIQRLDPVVADQIAAGEVVERPASVVKELVENAVDAGATRITVSVHQGGLQGIRVEDNGEGMSREDLLLAVTRHATSKIRRLEDLRELATLGFRGEALAAIAAVSELRVTSRIADAPEGFLLAVQEGRMEPLVPVGRAPGTVVECEHLFRAVPARHKMLRSASAELAAIAQVVSQAAVVQPATRFRFIADGSEVWVTPGDGVPRHAVAAIFGAGLADRLLPVNGHALHGTVRVEGLAAPAQDARGNRHGQMLAVNHRPVRQFVLRAAVEEAFRPFLAARRYPLFWLDVTVPADEVDANAHPAKAEVRLERERVVAGVVHAAVADALRLAPAFTYRMPDGTSPSAVAAAEHQMTFAPAESLPAPGPAEANGDPSAPPLHQEILQLTPLAQWQARYILAQGLDGLYLIDQHAAHERVYYDQLVSLAEREATLAQPLLLPIPLTLTMTEWAAWEAHRAWLGRAGFEVEELGGTTVAVRAVPAFLAAGADLHLLTTIMDSLAGEGPDPRHPVSWLDNQRLATAACKAAVKASKGLSQLEMRALIDAMAASPAPRSCPHGRPTLLVLRLEEVDHRFGR